MNHSKSILVSPEEYQIFLTSLAPAVEIQNNLVKFVVEKFGATGNIGKVDFTSQFFSSILQGTTLVEGMQVYVTFTWVAS